jgi:peroxiredoxin family protein
MPAPEQLSLVVHSGEAGKVHYAWMMAASALAIGKGATLFFTGEAIASLRAPAPPDTEELIQACAQLGAKLMLCEAGLIAAKLKRVDLRGDLELAECGIVTFLNDCDPNGQIVFI